MRHIRTIVAVAALLIIAVLFIHSRADVSLSKETASGGDNVNQQAGSMEKFKTGEGGVSSGQDLNAPNKVPRPTDGKRVLTSAEAKLIRDNAYKSVNSLVLTKGIHTQIGKYKAEMKEINGIPCVRVDYSPTWYYVHNRDGDWMVINNDKAQIAYKMDFFGPIGQQLSQVMAQQRPGQDPMPSATYSGYESSDSTIYTIVAHQSPDAMAATVAAMESSTFDNMLSAATEDELKKRVPAMEVDEISVSDGSLISMAKYNANGQKLRYSSIKGFPTQSVATNLVPVADKEFQILPSMKQVSAASQSSLKAMLQMQ